MLAVRKSRSSDTQTRQFQLADDVAVENFITSGFLLSTLFRKVDSQIVEWNKSSILLHLSTESVQVLHELTSRGFFIVFGCANSAVPYEFPGFGIPNFAHQTT